MPCMMLSPENLSPALAPAPYIALLDQCRSRSKLEQVHAHLILLGLAPFSFVASRLLAAFAAAGHLAHARRLFHRIPHPTLFDYNAMLIAHSRSPAPAGGLSLFARMRSLGVAPDARTFPFAVKSCSLLSSVSQVHAQVIKFGFCADAYVVSALIGVYSSCGGVDAARRVFDAGCGRDVVVWTSMVSGYCAAGFVGEARKVFDEMPVKNDVSWGAMVAGYVKNGCFGEVVRVFCQWRCEVGLRSYTPVLVSVLSACAGLGAARLGRWVHSFAVQHGVERGLELGTALIDFYAKCGCVENARLVFDRMVRRDVTAWSALIMGFAVNGFSSLAFEHFELMQKSGAKPNEVTFIGVLTACNHGGLVDEGWEYFNLMTDVYGVSPTLEHYGCMVDLLGRAGHVQEAKELVLNMPMQPDGVVLGALLNGCVMHRHLELAEKVGRLLVEIEPQHGGRYIGLANTYAGIGHWTGVVSVRKTMIERGVSTVPACSFV